MTKQDFYVLMKQGSFEYYKGMAMVTDQEGQLWGIYDGSKPFKVERKTRMVEEIYYEIKKEVK